MEDSFDLKVERARSISGGIKAPPSKSYTQRAVIIGGMDESAEVVNPLRSEDTMNAVAAVGSMGAAIDDRGDSILIKGFDGNPRPRGGVVNVGENGTLLRFVLAVLSLGSGEFRVEGEKSLMKRPNSAIVNALRSLGVEIRGRGDSHTVPVTVAGKGSLDGGEVVMDGRTTSQAVSALLAVAPYTRGGLSLRIENGLVSKPYVDITLDVMAKAGVAAERDGYRYFRVEGGQRFRPGRMLVHGDYSSAAFPLAAAAVTESDISVDDLVHDCQGDRKIVGILEAMGAKLSVGDGRVSMKGPFELRGVELDCADTPDLVPVLTVLGCFASGRTLIRNVSHLAYKESNRLAQPAGELAKLGARIRATADGIEVERSRLGAGIVSAGGDHRVAMALAVAGLGIEGGLRILGAQCINKSYPGFIEDMRALGAGMTVCR